MPRKVLVQIPVTAPDNMEDSQLANIIGQMLDIGFNDAVETCNNPDLERWKDAEDAASLEIGTAEAVPDYYPDEEETMDKEKDEQLCECPICHKQIKGTAEEIIAWIMRHNILDGCPTTRVNKIHQTTQEDQS